MLSESLFFFLDDDLDDDLDDLDFVIDEEEIIEFFVIRNM